MRSYLFRQDGWLRERTGFLTELLRTYTQTWRYLQEFTETETDRNRKLYRIDLWQPCFYVSPMIIVCDLFSLFLQKFISVSIQFLKLSWHAKDAKGTKEYVSS